MDDRMAEMIIDKIQGKGVTAVKMIQNGDSERGIEELQKIVELSKTLGPVINLTAIYQNIGVGYENLRRYAEAEEHYRMAVKISPDYVLGMNGIGKACLEQKKYREAESWYLKSIKQEPSYQKPYAGLIDVYIGIADFPKLKNISEILLRLNPGDGAGHFGMGEYFFHTGDFEQAASCCSRAVQLREGFTGAYEVLGWSYFSLNRYKDASDAFTSAITADKTSAMAWHGLGNCMFFMEDDLKAEGAYKEALKHRPDHIGALQGLGNLALLKGDYKEAEKRYLAVIDSFDRNRPEQYMEPGSIFGRIKKRITKPGGTSPLKGGEQALQICTWYCLLQLYDKTGETEKADKIYEKIIEYGIEFNEAANRDESLRNKLFYYAR